MTKKYRATRTLEITLNGSSLEIEAELEFTIQPYVPAEGTSYASGGQPAEGGGVEDVCVQTLNTSDAPVGWFPGWFSDWIVENVDRDSLYQEAIKMDKGERDAAAEHRAEMAREDRAYRRSHPMEY